jgi:hypothetical protein
MIAPFLILAWLASFVAIGETSEFSADILRSNADGTPSSEPGKIYVSNDKVRIETPDVTGGFFIIDGATNIALFVQPEHRLFMDAKQSSLLTQILVPVDPRDPCPKLQVMAINAGSAEKDSQWRCDRVGQEVIEGRETIAFSTMTAKHKQRAEWIEPELKFPIRSRTESGLTIDLKNIKEGPQPASLFEIPANYRKFDPQRLIDIIKQSDVWVEPPK